MKKRKSRKKMGSGTCVVNTIQKSRLKEGYKKKGFTLP